MLIEWRTLSLLNKRMLKKQRSRLLSCISFFWWPTSLDNDVCCPAACQLLAYCRKQPARPIRFPGYVASCLTISSCWSIQKPGLAWLGHSAYWAWLPRNLPLQSLVLVPRLLAHCPCCFSLSGYWTTRLPVKPAFVDYATSFVTDRAASLTTYASSAVAQKQDTLTIFWSSK